MNRREVNRELRLAFAAASAFLALGKALDRDNPESRLADAAFARWWPLVDHQLSMLDAEGAPNERQ